MKRQLPDLTWLAEWRKTRSAYHHAGAEKRQTMQLRALYFAAHTIHTPWRESFYRLTTGADPALPVAEVFFTRRCTLRPAEWPKVNPKSQAKSQFARALLGFDDAACFDVHMLRHYPKLAGARQWHGSTVWQWAVWLLKVYPSVYPERGALTIRQHCEILRWVRTGVLPPAPPQDTLFDASQEGDRHRRRVWGMEAI